MAVQSELALSQASSTAPLPPETLSTAITSVPPVSRPLLTPRSQFDRYMADVKKTALLSSQKLTALSRDAYVHRFCMIEVLSHFPPCAEALSEQYLFHVENDFKMRNFVTGYGDQSLNARDDLYALNRQVTQSKLRFDKLELAGEPQNEARIARTLENLTKLCEVFRVAEWSVRRTPKSSLRRKISETYMFVALRYHELERHKEIFEALSDQVQQVVDELYAKVPPANQQHLLALLESADVDQIMELIGPRQRRAFKAEAATLRRLLKTIGLSIKEIICLRSRYQHHKDQQNKLINQLVESNLLLSARETIRTKPADDRLFDTCQEANQGLITAAYRYDYWRGYAFSTYAIYWIKQRLNLHRDNAVNGAFPIPCSVASRAAKVFRSMEQRGDDPSNALSSHQIAESLGCSRRLVDQALQAYTPAAGSDEMASVVHEEQPDVSDIASVQDLQAIVREVVESLPQPKRDICKMRWGVGYPVQLTLAEVAKIKGITKEGIRQIEMDGMRILCNGKHASLLRELHHLF